MKKSNVPDTAPKFNEVHVATIALTLLSGTISALCASYHIYADAEFSIGGAKEAFTVLGGLFALTMALMPMFLAKPHGESMEGGNAQTGLIIIVFMVMGLDGALQIHAATVIMEALNISLPAWWLMAIGAGMFQMSMFFMRGTLFAATKEIQELIDARAHDLEMAAAYAKEQQLAKRREDYHAKKSNVVNIKG